MKQTSTALLLAALLAGALLFPAAGEQSGAAGNPLTRKPRKIYGRVLGDDGRPLDGVRVFLEGQSGRAKRETVSDGRGLWIFPSVPGMKNEEFILVFAAEGYLTRRSRFPVRAEAVFIEVELHQDPRLLPAALTERAPAPAGEAWPAPADGKSDEKLHEALRLAAGYCRRLEGAAFKYFCQETVEETTWPGREYSRSNRFQYDFQITGKRGRISERRLLLTENGEKAKRKESPQRTVFQSELGFFSPVDLLGAARQPFYRYRLLGEEAWSGRACLLIEAAALRRDGGTPLIEGRVLVDGRDGSVVRVEIAQESIQGFAERRERMREEGFDDIRIHDAHWYEIEKGGLRFPSRIEMRETCLSGEYRTVHYVVDYAYRDYRFFEVRVESTIDGAQER